MLLLQRSSKTTRRNEFIQFEHTATRQKAKLVHAYIGWGYKVTSNLSPAKTHLVPRISINRHGHADTLYPPNQPYPQKSINKLASYLQFASPSMCANRSGSTTRYSTNQVPILDPANRLASGPACCAFYRSARKNSGPDLVRLPLAVCCQPLSRQAMCSCWSTARLYHWPAITTLVAP